MLTIQITESLKKRFWDKVSPEPMSGCFLWTGCPLKFGYGRIKQTRKKSLLAHRVSYVLNIGDIPKDMLVLHKCDNRMCVNPQHLFLGTSQDNQNDMIKKGRKIYSPLFSGNVKKKKEMYHR